MKSTFKIVAALQFYSLPRSAVVVAVVDFIRITIQTWWELYTNISVDGCFVSMRLYYCFFLKKNKHKIFLFHAICCRVCVGDVDHTQFLIENISISILVIWAFRFQQNFGRDFLYFIIDFPYSNIDSHQTNFDLSFRMNFFQHRLSFQINWRLKTTDSTKIYS